VEQGHEALKLAKKIEDNYMISLACSYLSGIYNIKGHLDEAVKYGEMAIEIAPTPVNKLGAQMILGWAISRSGEPKRGIEMLEEVVPIHHLGGHVIFEVYGGIMLGEAYWLAEDDEKANQTLERYLELSINCGMKYCLGWIYRLLGEVALRSHIDQAGNHFRESIKVLNEINAKNELALAYAGYGRYYEAIGHISQGREYLTEALKIFERLGTLIEPEKIKKELAVLPET
jgi:tetratricopeptide (TPR) repeat protein